MDFICNTVCASAVDVCSFVVQSSGLVHPSGPMVRCWHAATARVSAPLLEVAPISIHQGQAMHMNSTRACNRCVSLCRVCLVCVSCGVRRSTLLTLLPHSLCLVFMSIAAVCTQFFIRRLKKNVLTQLPTKVRQRVPLVMTAAAQRRISKTMQKMKDNREVLAALEAQLQVAPQEMDQETAEQQLKLRGESRALFMKAFQELGMCELGWPVWPCAVDCLCRACRAFTVTIFTCRRRQSQARSCVCTVHAPR